MKGIVYYRNRAWLNGTVWIGVICQHINGHNSVIRGVGGIITSNRRLINIKYSDIHGGLLRNGPLVIFNSICQRILTAVICSRCIGDRSMTFNYCSPMKGIVYYRNRAWLNGTVWIGIICQHINDHNSVIGGVGGIIIYDRRFIKVNYSNGHGGLLRNGPLAIFHSIGKRILTTVVGSRCIGYCSIIRNHY